MGTFTAQNDQGAALQSIVVSNHNSLTATVEFRVYVFGASNFYESVGVGNRSGAAGTYDLAVLGSSANTSTPPASTTGQIIREFWTNVGGTAISQIPLTQPASGTAVLTSLEGPTNWGDNYGTRIRGYVIPSTTGAYTFYVAGDDNTDLYLSSNANPTNKARIAYVSGWTNSREWAKYTTQKSAVVNLVAGQKYYVEILHKEGGGGDNVAVGWTGPGISAITVIGGVNIAPYQINGGRLATEESINAQSVIRVFPNPASHEISLSGLAEPSLVEVVDPQGRVLKRQDQVPNQHPINVAELNSGLYILRVFNNRQGTTSHKIIKQ